jgi:hypothetical protein
MRELSPKQALRDKLAAVTGCDLVVVVKIALEAVNEASAGQGVADILGISYAGLMDWGDRVLFRNPADDSIQVATEMRYLSATQQPRQKIGTRSVGD